VNRDRQASEDLPRELDDETCRHSMWGRPFGGRIEVNFEL